MKSRVIGAWGDLEWDYMYEGVIYRPSVWRGFEKVWDQWPEKLNKKNSTGPSLAYVHFHFQLMKKKL